ncbi:MAG TPA: serine/threonine-protein kinase [Nostocaceae cyanobacterium]|nr:serine/threonine-protein kinase [Nostocaceae cyanobacterium]
MEVYCTRPTCPRPKNYFADLDNTTTLKTTQQKYCTTCGMPLLLDGRYVPTKLLGKGGFGAAFLAFDRRVPGMRPCVVKQFQPAGNLTPTQLQLAQQLFEREAEVLDQIGSEHEQIPNLFAFFPVAVHGLQPGQQEQFFYLVQEYIDGKNLEEELIQKGKFTEAEIIEILLAILPVLQYVHNRGIIHRDIKPSNIMRRQDGKLFLLDFGAVKQVTNAPSASAVSTGIYSLGYAPPEQMSGGQVFPSTDLYALAVTVITLITSQEATKLFNSFTNQWEWHSSGNINPQLAEILDKMLLPAANQRFQSAQEVLDAINQFLTPLPVLPTQPQPPTQIPPQPQQQIQQPPPPRPPVVRIQPTFAVWELLGGAAFSGFEGAMVAIAFYSLLKNPIISFGIAFVILTVLIFAQTKRWIEKFDLLIIPAISLAVIFFVPALQANLGIQNILLFGGTAALVAIAITTLFRLIYILLSLFL